MSTISLVLPAILFLTISLAGEASAVCTTWAPDVPDHCACANASQGWPVTAALGEPLLIFDQIIGVRTECSRHRGQPYWQLQKFWGSPDLVATVGEYKERYFSASTPSTDQQAWCSETVAYVHYASQFPYPRGFHSPALPSAFLVNVTQLRNWYHVEEVMTQAGIYVGRGRWIDGAEFDPLNFIPGVNAPVPGAYQLIEDFTTPGGWVGSSTAHSQMIDSMVVTLDWQGHVISMDVFIVDGNVGNRTTLPDGNQRTRTRSAAIGQLERYTILGDLSFGSPPAGTVRKVRGWGIPMDGFNQPEYDPSRLVININPNDTYDEMLLPPVDPELPDSVVIDIANFMEVTGGDIAVFSDPGNTITQDYPTTESPWVIDEPNSIIEIDLGAEYPVPVEGLVLTWQGGFVPQQLVADLRSGQGDLTTVQTLIDLTVEEPLVLEGGPYRIPIELLVPEGSASVKTITLRIPDQAWDGPAELVGLDFRFDLGEDEIAFEPPNAEATSVPQGEIRPSTALAWDENGGTVFYRQVDANFRSELNGTVAASVYDLRGHLVRDLGIVASAPGRHAVGWDGRDRSGQSVSHGVYFLRLKGQGANAVLRFVMTR